MITKQMIETLIMLGIFSVVALIAIASLVTWYAVPLSDRGHTLFGALGIIFGIATLIAGFLASCSLLDSAGDFANFLNRKLK